MNSQDQIDSYLPELSFLDGKQERTARTSAECCAVVDLNASARILAARGGALSVGNSLYTSLSMRSTEQKCFADALAEHRRFLLCAGQTPILVLADWLPSTGFCLVILPNASPAAVRAAMQGLERTDIVDLLGPDLGRAPLAERREAHAHLLDILRYTDRILSPHTPPRHLLYASAAFAGCYAVQCSTDKADGVESLGERTSAFLLCTLLSIRAVSGALESGEMRNFPVRATLQYTTPTQCAKDMPFPFLQAGCFEGYRIAQRGNAYVLTLPEKVPLSVCAGGSSDLSLCIELLQCAG